MAGHSCRGSFNPGSANYAASMSQWGLQEPNNLIIVKVIECEMTHFLHRVSHLNKSQILVMPQKTHVHTLPGYLTCI